METNKELSNRTVILMAVAAGVIVANLNYIQPIEGLIAASFHVTKAAVGAVAMLTQLGYAFGLLLIVPLGDIFNRHKLIQTMLVLSIGSCLIAFLSPNILVLGIASLLVGITSVAPQIIIPYAAYLSSGFHRGRVLGNVLSGLLAGILISRSVSGLIGSVMDWHFVYLIAAVACTILFFVLQAYLPRDVRGHQDIRYRDILASLPRIFRSEKYLQGAAINGFCLFGLSNVLWSTLAFYLADQYHLGSGVAGLLGLLGITGVLFASIIGRIVDTYSPRLTIGLGILFSAVAFVIFALLGQFFIALIVGIVLLDLGTQFGQVSNQAIVQSINPAASNRNNSIFMFSYFLGGAFATFMSTLAWTHFGWMGVCSVALFFVIVATISHLVLKEPQKIAHAED